MNNYRSSLYEPLSIEENKRSHGTPVGLKNVGNTCFINSLFQCYFMIPPLVREIMLAAYDTRHLEIHPCCKFVDSLQNLFSYMIASTRKYADPTNALAALESIGMRIGYQEDICEFHMLIVENINKGLMLCKQQENSQLWVSLKDQGKLDSIFNGKQEEILTWVEENEEKIEVKEVPFGPIMLDIEREDLYNAWEEGSISTIKGFRSENGNETEVHQEVWIKTAPSVLMFQIKRFFYIAGDQEPLKNNSGFKFPQMVYADRMLIENREAIKELKLKSADIKENIRKYKEIIKALAYSQSKIPIIEVFKTAKEYLESECAQELLPKNEELIKLLGEVSEKVAQKMEETQAAMLALSTELENLYSEYMKNPYSLHSILVHQGQTGSGHYYSFIKDYDTGLWRKYNDIYVTAVTEEEVMKVAEGGNDSTASAYFLVYAKEGILKSNSGLAMHSFSVSAKVEIIDEYTTYLKENLIKRINEENWKDDDQRSSFLVNSIFESIKQKYQERHIMEIENYHYYKNMPGKKHFFWNLYSITNFLLYQNKDNLAKIMILENVVKEITGHSIKEKENAALFEKLKVCRYIGPSFPILESVKEFEQISGFVHKYNEQKAYLLCANFIIRNVIESNISIAIKAFVGLFLQSKKCNEEIHTNVSEAFKIVLISLVSTLIGVCKHLESSDIKDLCMMIQMLLPYYSTTNLGKSLTASIKEAKAIYKKDFGKKKPENLENLDLALSAEVDISFLIENVPPAISELQSKLNQYEQNPEDDSYLVDNLRDLFNKFYDSDYLFWVNIYTKLTKQGVFTYKDLDSIRH